MSLFDSPEFSLPDDAPPEVPSSHCAAASPACALLLPVLTAYFDGETDALESDMARRHLFSCAHCARMWRDWGDLRLVLQSQIVPSPPPQMAARVVQASRLKALLKPSAPLISGSSALQDNLQAPSTLQSAILEATTHAKFSKVTGAAPAAALPRIRRSRTSRRLMTATALPLVALWLLALSNRTPRGWQETTTPTPAVNPSPTLQIQNHKTVAKTRLPVPIAAAISAARPTPRASAVTRYTVTPRPISRAPQAAFSAPAPEEAIEAAKPSALRSRQNTSEVPRPPLAAISIRDRAEEVSSTKATFAPSRPYLIVAPADIAADEKETGRAALVSRAVPVTSTNPDGKVESGATAAQSAVPSARSQAEAMHEGEARSSLADVELLNDNRPAEIGQAIDAYALTFDDESGETNNAKELMP